MTVIYRKTTDRTHELPRLRMTAGAGHSWPSIENLKSNRAVFDRFKISASQMGEIIFPSANLDLPIVYLDVEKAQEKMGEEIAFFNTADSYVSINLAKLIEIAGIQFLPVIIAHERGHPSLNPQTLNAYAVLLDSAEKSLSQRGQWSTARFIVNLFADIVVNKEIHWFNLKQQETVGIKEFYAALTKYKREHDEMKPWWRVYAGVYDSILKDRDDILKPDDWKDIDIEQVGKEKEAIDKLSLIIENMAAHLDSWSEAISKFAPIMEAFLKKPEEGDGKGEGKENGEGEGERSTGIDNVDRKNYEPMDPKDKGTEKDEGSPQGADKAENEGEDKSKTDKSKAGKEKDESSMIEPAGEKAPDFDGAQSRTGVDKRIIPDNLRGLLPKDPLKPGEYERFKELLVKGLNLDRKTAVILAHRELARRNAGKIKPPQHTVQVGRSPYPVGYQRWHTGDPLSEIAFKKLAREPLRMPSRILKPYYPEGEEYPGPIVRKRPTNILLLMDSSGSMPDLYKEPSPLVIGGKTIINAALLRKAYIYVINYSQRSTFITTNGFTQNEDEIDSVLCERLAVGSATTFPIEAYLDALARARQFFARTKGGKLQVIIISDTEVAHFVSPFLTSRGALDGPAAMMVDIGGGASLPYFAGGSIFVNAEEDDFKDLVKIREHGFKLIPVPGWEGLNQLSRKTAADLYLSNGDRSW